MLILIIAGITVTSFAVGEGPVDLSGTYKPTYYPYPMASSSSGRITATLDTPIARTLIPSSSQVSTPNQVIEQFRIIGESNQPLLGAEFSGRDGVGNSIGGITDDNGYVNITGAPGNWQFLIYDSGYYSNTLIYPFTYSTSKDLKLQTVGPLEKLNLDGHEDKKEFTTKIIIMPAFCSNTTEQSSNLTTDQSSYTGDEG